MLAVTAIAEATQQRGIICGECLGTGKTKTHYSKFVRTLDVPYCRFIHYKPVLEERSL